MLATELNWYWIVIVAIAVFSLVVTAIGDNGGMRKTKSQRVVHDVAEGVGAVFNLVVFAGIGIVILLAFILKW